MRRAFLDGISEADARYYDFQVWKEGTARWTELAIARAGAGANADLARIAQTLDEDMISAVQSVDLAAQNRVAFYAMGSAEAEILEHLNPAWRARYLAEMYDMDALFDFALEPDAH